MTPASPANSNSATTRWQDVLDFWFFPADDERHLTVRTEWFAKDAGFDDRIRHEFGDLLRAALNGGLSAWEDEPESALACVLLLDQFTRNIGRDTPQAFAGDAQALALARKMVARGDDAHFPPIQRQFIYLPFMHAEDLATQEQCVSLYQALVAEDATLAGALDFAIRHCDIIARFGRFPHRNQQLSRDTTPEEAEFLRQPGSSF